MRLYLMNFQISFTELSSVYSVRKESVKNSADMFRSSRFAFFQRLIHLHIGFQQFAMRSDSMWTMSWSLSPMPGPGKQGEGRLVRKTSRVLSFRVLNSTICSSPVRCNMLRNRSLIARVFWLSMINPVFQHTSGRLRSPSVRDSVLMLFSFGDG